MAQDNVDVVQGAWDAFGRGDIEAVLDAIAAGGRDAVPETLPWGGTYAGPDGFRDFIARLNDNFEQFKATPDKVLGADDNHVIVPSKVKGRTKGGDHAREPRRLDLPAARRPESPTRRRSATRRRSSRRSAEPLGRHRHPRQPRRGAPGACRRSSPARDGDELIVVDNDSSDGTADAVRELAPAAIVIEAGREPRLWRRLQPRRGGREPGSCSSS